MKKVLSILGITAIIAIAFFNVSLITDTNKDVDLASVAQLQNANAEEVTEGNHFSQQVTFSSSLYYGVNNQYTNYYYEQSCIGSGNKYCQAYVQAYYGMPCNGCENAVNGHYTQVTDL